MRRRTLTIAALGLAILAGGVLLSLLEAVLNLVSVDPGLAAMASAEAAGRPFDPRSRMQVVADLRAEGRRAVPRIVPAALLQEESDGMLHSVLSSEGVELLPLAGISRSTTVLCNETGRYAIYESDAHGLRNPTPHWPSAPVDLVLIGDSFGIGECVDPGETIADRLRARWPDVVNLSYSGHSPQLELATLTEYAPSLRPRRVVWFYFENDLSAFDLGRSARSPLLMRYLRPDFSQALVSRQPEIDAQLRRLLDSKVGQPYESGPANRRAALLRPPAQRLVDFLSLSQTRRAFRRFRSPVPAATKHARYALLERILRQADARVSSWGGELVLVFLPGVWRFETNGDYPDWSPRDVRERLRERADAIGLRFLDLQPALAQDPDPLSLYSYRGESRLGSPHLNARGYARVADVVAALLVPSGESARRSQISRQ